MMNTMTDLALLCLVSSLVLKVSSVGLLASVSDQSFLSAQLYNFSLVYPNIDVEIITAPTYSPDILSLIHHFLQAGLQLHTQVGLDILPLDVIWQGDLAQNLLDLTPLVNSISNDLNAQTLDSLQVNGKYMSMPGFQDFPLLFYRKDLLEKYYGVGAQPPQDWDTLEDMARYIQDKERQAGRSQFWGYLWQGVDGEPLTCNVMEWINSHGGGELIDPDSQRVTLNNPFARKALLRAQRWIGDISPFTCLFSDETATHEIWASGNAMFTRQWIIEISQSNQLYPGNYSAIPLPKDNSPNGKHAGTHGGWNQAISKYSENITQAIELLAFLSSPEQQLFRYSRTGLYPTLLSVLNSSSFCNKSDNVSIQACQIDTPEDYIVLRPSSITAPYYSQISNIISSYTNEFLLSTASTESINDVDGLLKALECDISRVLFTAIELPDGCLSQISVSQSALTFSLILITFGILCSGVGFVFLFIYRHSPIIKAASTLFLGSVLFGIFSAFITLLFITLSVAYPWSIGNVGCNSITIMEGMSFVAVVGSLIIKMHRLNAIFKSAEASRPTLIPIWKLMLANVLIFVIDCIFSSLRISQSPLSVTKVLNDNETAFVWKCVGPSKDPLLYLQITWRGLLLACASGFAFVARAVPNSFSEKRNTAFLIYNMCFFSLLYLSLRSTLMQTADQDLLVQVVFVSIPMYAVLVLWVGLKVLEVRTTSEEDQKLKIEDDIQSVTFRASSRKTGASRPLALNASKHYLSASTDDNTREHLLVTRSDFNVPREPSKSKVEDPVRLQSTEVTEKKSKQSTGDKWRTSKPKLAEIDERLGQDNPGSFEGKDVVNTQSSETSSQRGTDMETEFEVLRKISLSSNHVDEKSSHDRKLSFY
jgi:trehalose/maltose transport system substrate-binding protein